MLEAGCRYVRYTAFESAQEMVRRLAPLQARDLVSPEGFMLKLGGTAMYVYAAPMLIF